MDSETLKLIETFAEGATLLQVSLVGATMLAGAIGAYFGAYLKQRGKHDAIADNFHQILDQQKLQTEATEQIKNRFETMQTDIVYLLELYSIADYSSAQASALNESYLLLFEPESSDDEYKLRGFDERVTRASKIAMRPLRTHINILDKATRDMIYNVNVELSKCEGLKGAPDKGFYEKRLEIWALTERASNFVKPYELALRLKMIANPLKEQSEDK